MSKAIMAITAGVFCSTSAIVVDSPVSAIILAVGGVMWGYYACELAFRYRCRR